MSQEPNDFQQSQPQQQYGQPQQGGAPQGYGQGGAPQGYGQGGFQAEDPGKTLGIVGFVLAFIAAPVGIVLSAMSKKKSREAGFPVSGLAKWGFILSIIFTILGILYIVFAVIAVIALGGTAASGY